MGSNGITFRSTLPYDSSRDHHLLRRALGVRRATVVGQGAAALVRRLGHGVDDVPDVFSSRLAGWLRLRARGQSLAVAASPGLAARCLARGLAGSTADPAQRRRLE